MDESSDSEMEIDIIQLPTIGQYIKQEAIDLSDDEPELDVDADDIDEAIKNQIELRKIEETEEFINRYCPKFIEEYTLGNNSKEVNKQFSDFTRKLNNIDNAIQSNFSLIKKLSIFLNTVKAEISKIQNHLNKKNDDDPNGKEYEMKEIVSSIKQNVKFSSKYMTRFTIDKFSFLLAFSKPYFKDKNNFTHSMNRDALYRRQMGLVLSSEVYCKFWRTNDFRIMEASIKKSFQSHLRSISQHKSLLSKPVNFLLKYNYCNDDLLNWDKISEQLDRSPEECKKVWDLYLKPTITQDKWTKNEEERLLDIACKYGRQNWASITHDLATSRTILQCFVRFIYLTGNKLTHGKWTVEEDERLNFVVKMSAYGQYINWRKVSYYLESRTLQQSYSRYNESLKPVLKGRFSEEEDKILIQCIHNGLDYNSVAIRLQRSATQVRNRYLHHILRNAKKSIKFGDWSYEEDEKLMELVSLYGFGNWAVIAKYFTTRNRTQLRLRYNLLMKKFKNNPDLTIADLKRFPTPRTWESSKIKKHKRLLNKIKSGKVKLNLNSRKLNKPIIINDINKVEKNNWKMEKIDIAVKKAPLGIEVKQYESYNYRRGISIMKQINNHLSRNLDFISIKSRVIFLLNSYSEESLCCFLNILRIDLNCENKLIELKYFITDIFSDDVSKTIFLWIQQFINDSEHFNTPEKKRPGRKMKKNKILQMKIDQKETLNLILKLLVDILDIENMIESILNYRKDIQLDSSNLLRVVYDEELLSNSLPTDSQQIEINMPHWNFVLDFKK